MIKEELATIESMEEQGPLDSDMLDKHATLGGELQQLMINEELF